MTARPYVHSIPAHVAYPDFDQEAVGHKVFIALDGTHAGPGHPIIAYCGYVFETSERDPADLDHCPACIDIARAVVVFRRHLLDLAQRGIPIPRLPLDEDGGTLEEWETAVTSWLRRLRP